MYFISCKGNLSNRKILTYSKKASKIKAWSPWILFSILSILPMPIAKLRENHENKELRNIFGT